MKRQLFVKPARSRTETPKIEHATAGCVRATWNNVAIVIWRGEDTLARDVIAAGQMLERASAVHKKLGFVQVIEPQCKSLDSDARAALGRLLANGTSYIGCSVVIFLAGGFRAASVRAIATGLAMLARHKFPHVVCSSVRQAVQTMSEHLVCGDLTAGEFAIGLERVVEQIRTTPATDVGNVSQ